MNSLTEDEDTYYFENFYEQTGQGNTSDSEFMVANSLYPLSRGAVAFTHGGNEFQALPEILGHEGYYSSVFHANNKSFWNRDELYNSFDYDHFYDEDSYEVTEENSEGWGLLDKPFFEQSMKYLQSQDEPFYSNFITLTNHFPFDLSEEERSIEPYDSNSNTLNQYFPTARYTDEAIEEFFDHLKDTDLYEDSMIVIMGDHIGISANHNRAMAQYLDKDEITPFDQVQLQRVPFFVHIPGHGEGEVRSEVTGQIDVKPTILSLLGVESENNFHFGNDVFAEDRKGYIALRNGDFISDDFVSTSGVCYDRETGEPIEVDEDEQAETEAEAEAEAENSTAESEPTNACTEIGQQVEKELGYSDDLIYGDLFRFMDFNEN